MSAPRLILKPPTGRKVAQALALLSDEASNSTSTSACWRIGMPVELSSTRRN
jgi:hypothetical protein